MQERYPKFQHHRSLASEVLFQSVPETRLCRCLLSNCPTFSWTYHEDDLRL